jgi:hypothetical protein
MPFAYKHLQMTDGQGSEIDPILTRENTPIKKVIMLTLTDVEIDNFMVYFKSVNPFKCTRDI